MLTYEGHITLQFSGKEEEFVATDCVKRRNVTHEETPVQVCLFLVPRGRSVEAAGPSQQQVNCWRHWKMNNSSWIHSKVESTGQTAAPQIRERMVRVQTRELDTLGPEPRRKTCHSWLTCWRLRVDKSESQTLQEDLIIGGPHNTVRFSSRSSTVLIH